MIFKRLLVAAALLSGCNAETIEQLSQHSEELAQIGKSLESATRSSETVPYSEEDIIGFELGSKLLGVENLVEDDALQTYVNQVGRWVASHGERPDIRWRFGVLDTPTVNAYALPGGYVLITRGMLKRLRNEAELAAVLGHEIAHIQEKHHLKAFQQNAGWNAFKQSVALGVKLNTERIGADGSQYLTGVVNQGIEVYGERGLDRRQEFEADRKGVVLAARAGYNPYAMAGVLQTLGAENPQDSALATLFKTHPGPALRMEKLANAMGERLEPYAAGLDDSKRFKQIVLKYR